MDLRSLKNLPEAKDFIDRSGATWSFRIKESSQARIPAVVMLPGASGTTEFFFQQAADWPADQALILVDYPGTIGPSALVDGFEDLIDYLGLDEIDFVGCSYSAYWGQIVAQRLSERLHRHVLCNGFTDHTDLKDNPLFDEGAISGVTPEELSLQWRKRIQDSPPSLLRDLLLRSLEDWLSPKDLQGRLLAVSRSEEVADMTLPKGKVLIVDCEDDPIIDEASRQRFRMKNSRYEAVTLTGGHYPYVTNPSEFQTRILKFLRNY